MYIASALREQSFSGATMLALSTPTVNCKQVRVQVRKQVHAGASDLCSSQASSPRPPGACTPAAPTAARGLRPSSGAATVLWTIHPSTTAGVHWHCDWVGVKNVKWEQSPSVLIRFVCSNVSSTTVAGPTCQASKGRSHAKQIRQQRFSQPPEINRSMWMTCRTLASL
eukprot:933159-Pelagomonas_calceolata.AAC.1